MEDLATCLKNLAPFIAMVILEFTDVGMVTLIKAAMNQGMSNLVLVVYYNSLAAIILLPFVIFRWKGMHLTFSLLCRYFVLGLLGTLGQILGNTGLKLSSPTLASATGNLLPIFTMLLAVMFRIEKLEIKKTSGLAISIGAVVSVTGAIFVTLYKGPQMLQYTSVPLDYNHSFLHTPQSDWILGGFILLITWTIASVWNVFQTCCVTFLCWRLDTTYHRTITVKEFPDKLVNMFFCILFTTLLSLALTFTMARDSRSWRLNADIEIVAVFYSALIGLVARSFVHLWCLQVKGPVFVAMFRPLGIAIAMVTGIFFLGDSLYLGRIGGAITIAIGFYVVMWGKAKQQCIVGENGVVGSEAYSQRSPLLQNNINHKEQV